MKRIYYIVFILSLCVVSCGLGEKSYPEMVFEKVKLNSNKIPDGFELHFTEIRGQLKVGNLVIVTPQNEVKKVNATEYVQNRYVNMFDADIRDIKDLKSDEETAPILKAALDMFQYADDIYKNDFPRIAGMIDEGKPAAEIDAAIAALEETKGALVDEKYNKVHDLIMPYADRHGVEYKMLNTPGFGKSSNK
ncbi:hypothetical protein [Sphingobacterium spiritivorum]|uniref:Uncharacterized protein n=1 Tax=Sphingobacterium spiritivorum ATCC 33861 TaxID=525373 RepID=D7VK74_SPHSI|nr:hypothetical protein [Sphingobacterium spiritivorum]EFK58676.1 hypothetical protein HMPREF0766_11393 [Sphingobacterium spiritivorum ATCC 33861]QQT34426.1 hypothetical protein I6J01_13960 [Sphingobacterium spiritivorum]WQD35278.1 hypothetical protein U0038_05895 [Sphingobacterium spiritivorum]SUI99870.1 Uncharacterised protein [Sphingobacterium spiritivorum]